MANVLLINPSYQGSYGSAKASIAAVARERGHKVKIADMSWRQYDYKEIQKQVHAFKPDVIGVTATTPLMYQLRDISVLVKDISKQIIVTGGGAHPSALPEETMRESLLDAIFLGEADFSFAELCDGKPMKEIQGLYYRDKEEIRSTGLRTPIERLDDLPMPAWDLYETEQYRKHASRLLIRRPPATMAEFSRGCVFKCDFCASKITMALGYRKKSPERCAEEVKKLYSLGFREFMLADDIFTSDQQWAVQVCEAIIKTGVKMAWSCTNGIRVESANEKLFQTLKKAGCYRVSFGFESGSDEVLKKFGKGGKASIEQGKRAVNLARQAGIDTNGYFMLGLSPDTEETMEETIEFARRLPLDMLKFGTAIAFPGTPMFKDYLDKGMIQSFEWDDYHIYTNRPLFAHAHLDNQSIKKFMDLAYKRTIITNFSYIFRRIMRGIRTGEFFWDAYYFLRFIFMPATQQAIPARYYARGRWPVHDFQKTPPKPADYQKAKYQPESLRLVS